MSNSEKIFNAIPANGLVVPGLMEPFPVPGQQENEQFKDVVGIPLTPEMLSSAALVKAVDTDKETE